MLTCAATDEWHDSRLIPWVHFVPFDNTYRDFYAIMAYFVGMPPYVGGREEAARQIAEDGSSWAAKVLRKEDMLVYVYRLVLELARIMSDDRERMAFVET